VAGLWPVAFFLSRFLAALIFLAVAAKFGGYVQHINPVCQTLTIGEIFNQDCH